MRLAAAAVLAAGLLLGAAPARADLNDYLGRPVRAQVLVADGRPVTDPRLVALLETRVGAPLTVAAVRESIAHLFTLGRYENVFVHADPDGDGVALRFELRPLQPITSFSLDVEGPGIDRGRLRQGLIDRFGDPPNRERADEISRYLETELAALGYLHATVRASVERTGPDRATLAFAGVPGARARIGDVRVEGDPAMSVAAFQGRLAARAGDPYQPIVLSARIEDYIESRRARGFYAARVVVTPRYTDDDRVVDLLFAVSQGPRVRVVFTGDPLPVAERDELVPIAREGSVDEDLLEDATNRIEARLRAQGFRDATAPHTREERDGELVIAFTVSRGPQYRVGPIEIVGNSSLPPATVQGLLRMRTGQPFSVTVLDADVAAIESAYQRQGFAAVEVEATTDDTVPFEGGDDVPIGVTLTIVEGVRTLVEEVTFEGNRAVGDVVLRPALGLQPGLPFFATQMALDRDAIELQYANLGFPAAVVTGNPRFSPDGREARVVFTVTEGQQVRVDHILIVGNERTRVETIERELQVKPGDPLGLAAINESQRRLTALGLFRRARISSIQHGDPGRRDLLVSVEEAPLTSVNWGGGFQLRPFARIGASDDPSVASQRLEFAPRAFFEVGRRNLFGRNRSINLFTSTSLVPKREPADPNAPPTSLPQTTSALSFPQYRILGQYREPGVLGTGADFRVTGTFEQQSRASFDFSRRSASAEVARRLGPAVSVSGGYQIQRSSVFNVTVPSEQRRIDRILPKVRLSLFSTSVIRDTRDDPVNASRGRYLSANAQLAARAIGSEVGYAKSFFTAQTFRTLPDARNIVMAGSVRVGLASAFSSSLAEETVDLPASERFFAGGDTTVRGFALDQVGIRHSPPQPEDTLDSANLPLGGNGLIILNGEMRVPLRGSLGVVGFVDSGNVFKTVSDIDLGQLRVAVGFGVRYRSPVGPIRVDVGFKLDRQPIGTSREPLTAIHISLGQAF